MLTQIFIRDLATIEELAINFSHGTTMITGETGAGKSIFIEAIELALGARASQNLIRPGKEKAEITLCFDITNFPNVITVLKSLDLYNDTAECMIRRVISNDGRSRCYVNGVPATLNLTKELGEHLFHLHSQHQQQVLLNCDTQREMLDRYGDHFDLCSQVKKFAETYRQLQNEITELHNQNVERNSRIDFIRFQLDEFENLQLKPGEWQQLEIEHKRLTHNEELLRTLQLSILRINGEDSASLVALLQEIRRGIEAIRNYEPKCQEWLDTLSAVHIQLSDLESQFTNYVEKSELDAEQLQRTETRVAQIFNLARKYKIQPHDLADYRDQLAAELKILQNFEEGLAKLSRQIEEVKTNYYHYAEKLSQSRAHAASKLALEIVAIVRSLSLPHSEFQIQLETDDDDAISLHGKERINFLIKTNPDQTLQPLNKVISGGELSRLSLATHLALAHKTNIPTLIFDEVDTGLSGATAERIGKLLRKLGQTYQVFCITHQAQVAAYGHHHLLVEKNISQQRTHTKLCILNQGQKAKEIARMLAGEKITPKTLEHAKELLESV